MKSKLTAVSYVLNSHVSFLRTRSKSHVALSDVRSSVSTTHGSGFGRTVNRTDTLSQCIIVKHTLSIKLTSYCRAWSWKQKREKLQKGSN